MEEWRCEWTSTQKSWHLRNIDDGLPSKQALRLYGSLSQHQAYLLVQLRTSAPNSPASRPAGPVWRTPRPDVVESKP
jgi:hypothetical protein